MADWVHPASAPPPASITASLQAVGTGTPEGVVAGTAGMASLDPPSAGVGSRPPVAGPARRADPGPGGRGSATWGRSSRPNTPSTEPATEATTDGALVAR